MTVFYKNSYIQQQNTFSDLVKLVITAPLVVNEIRVRLLQSIDERFRI